MPTLLITTRKQAQMTLKTKQPKMPKSCPPDFNFARTAPTPSAAYASAHGMATSLTAAHESTSLPSVRSSTQRRRPVSPSSSGTQRDVPNVARRWRRARPATTSHVRSAGRIFATCARIPWTHFIHMGISTELGSIVTSGCGRGRMVRVCSMNEIPGVCRVSSRNRML
jgi:hypothetical protein